MKILGALLSDRLRPVMLPVLGFALVALWLGYGRAADARIVNWEDVADAPGQVVGQAVLVSFGRVMDVGSDRFVLRDQGHDLEVRGTLPGVARGRIVSVLGRLNADGVLELREGRVHRLRRLKWLSGVLALLVVGFLAARDLARLWREPHA